MKEIKGDLIQLALDGEFDVIVHGCNCMHTMGAGIAKTIAQKFPEAFAADKNTSLGDREKLGTISSAQVMRGDVRFAVVNAYTQFQWKGRGLKADYQAIERCFATIAQAFPNARIGYPMIGAGLAGGDWAIIKPSIDAALSGLDHTFVEFSA